MKRAIACLLAGMTLTGLAAPAHAQAVTYQVDLMYQKIVDGPRPTKTIRVTLRAPSARIAEFLCANSLLKLSRNVLANNAHEVGLAESSWLAGGGQCVVGQDGNVEMTVEPASGESN